MSFKKLHPKAKVKGKIEIKDKKVKTGKVRLSYANLFTPKTYQGKTAWSCVLLIDKSFDVSDLEVAAQNACIEKWGSDTEKWPSKVIRIKDKKVRKSILNWPIKDGDKDKADKVEYEGMYFINTNCKKRAPQVVDQKLKKIGEGDIKSGDYVRAVMIANAWETEDGTAKGVSFTLQMVQLWEEGEAFGGGRDASEEFDELPIDDPQDEDEETSDSEDEDGEIDW